MKYSIEKRRGTMAAGSGDLCRRGGSVRESSHRLAEEIWERESPPCVVVLRLYVAGRVGNGQSQNRELQEEFLARCKILLVRCADPMSGLVRRDKEEREKKIGCSGQDPEQTW